MPLSNIKKIAVLRANRLGDFIFSLPALQALKKTYPEAIVKVESSDVRIYSDAAYKNVGVEVVADVSDCDDACPNYKDAEYS